MYGVHVYYVCMYGVFVCCVFKVCKDVTLRVHVCFAFIYGMRVCLYVCLYVLHV